MENHIGLTWKAEAYVLGMNISGVQNVENFISQELKKYELSHLEAVAYNPHRKLLRLYFSKESSKKTKNFVKQVSKKKHPNLTLFLESQKATIDESTLLATIELEKVYLLFFSEYAK